MKARILGMVAIVAVGMLIGAATAAYAGGCCHAASDLQFAQWCKDANGHTCGSYTSDPGPGSTAQPNGCLANSDVSPANCGAGTVNWYSSDGCGS